VTARLPPRRNLGYVAAGGAVGAVVRVAFARWFPSTDGAFPLTTFAENVVGAFLLAVVLTLLVERVAADPAVRLLVCTGALGAFTTYSTLAVELDRLTAGRHLVVAGAYAVASLIAGVSAALIGNRLARGVSGSTRGRQTHPRRQQ
jgi:fluoride exporter